jgi:hypothetical protein
VTEHGDLDVLLIGRGTEPEKVQEPADEQERDRAAHVNDRGTCAEQTAQRVIPELAERRDKPAWRKG